MVIGEPNIYHQSVCFTRKWEDCGCVSDCEELSGGLLTGGDVTFIILDNQIKFVVL